ncbi:MAG: hypothetical protein HFJ50_02880 [Clostridia bacterium]|jgi:UDP-N-acetylmuramyl pentapeptide synthase|nr:hypothetical protein [Clostridia bacterium]
MNKENIFTYDTKQEAVTKAKEVMKKGDYVLVKSSSIMTFIDVTNGLI